MWWKNTPKIYYTSLDEKFYPCKVGEIYTSHDKREFHCYKNLLDWLQNNTMSDNLKFCEVTIGKNKRKNNLIVTNKITIVREIVGEELNNMLTGVYTEYLTYSCIRYVYSQKWYKNGKIHRDEDKPAVIFYYYNGQIDLKRWYKNGDLHRDEDNPAEISYHYNGKICQEWWYKNDKCHRDDDKPAAIYYNLYGKIFTKIYFKDGNLYEK